ncbi:MAG: formate dehydrogenase accessory sulfurtransferase FdhD [Planctomycetota bacterium]
MSNASDMTRDRASNATQRSAATAIVRFQGDERSEITDRVAIEEPLEIRVDFVANGARSVRSLSITMRTPGNDEELAAGFLLTEGLVRSARDIETIRPCGPESGAHDGNNVVKVRIADHATISWPNVERHFYATSSCGVCGKASLEALEVPGLCPIARDGFRFSVDAIRMLPAQLRAQQSVFEETGGLHAAALFNSAGELLAIREDVGRHNAVDKLLGEQFLQGHTPLSSNLLFLSGRISFELAQKALAGGIPMVVAVGAPSSLAIELAKRFDITLIGFLRGDRFNVYSGEWRLTGKSA